MASFVRIRYLSFLILLVTVLISVNLLLSFLNPHQKQKFLTITSKPSLISVVDYKSASVASNFSSLFCLPITTPITLIDMISQNSSSSKFPLFYICPNWEYPPNPNHDSMAKHLAETERGAFNKIWLMAKKYPNLLLLDIGANIGALSIPLAYAFPHIRVIAVEPQPRPSNLLTKGVILNKFQDRFLILNNAMSNVSAQIVRMVSYNTFLVFSRMDTFLYPNPEIPKTELNKVENEVKTITFDDLLPVVKKNSLFDQCVIKIDVEGAECLAMLKVENFLHQISVPLIVMETNKVPYVEERCVINAFDLLIRNDYVPYLDQERNLSKPLDPKSYKHWKHMNTIWVKRGTEQLFDL